MLVLALATLGLTVVAWQAAGPRGALVMLGAGALTLGIACGALALAVGGWEPLTAALHRLSDTSIVNRYMREYQSGGPEYYVRGLGLLQPVPVALGLLSALLIAPACFPLRTHGKGAVEIAGTTLAWLAIAFVAVALAYPQKNLRFLSPVYAPLDLLAGALVWAALGWLRPRTPFSIYRSACVALALLLFVSALGDHRRFVTYFIERQIPDLATPWFTR